MSKILLRSVLIILFFSPAITNAYTITIKVAGMKNQAILLGYYFGDKQYIKDSAKCDATGKVVFKGKDKLQGGIYLIASGDKKLLFDFVVTEQEFSLETDTIDFVKNMKIKGSPENEAFFAYSAFTIKMGIDATEAERKARIAKK